MALLRRTKKAAEVEVAEEVAPEPAAPLPDPPLPNPSGLRRMQDHRDYLLGLVEPLPAFGMSLLDAWGLTLCEDIAAEVDLPGFDNSQMDGYAVRAADVVDASPAEPVTLPVSGHVAAGEGAEPLPEGSVAKVMTGAPIPQGADAVVPVEDTDNGADQVRINQPSLTGAYIRRRGSDVTEGSQLLARGARLDARSIGLLAGAGVDKVLARPRPRVVVLSTGAELVEPGRPLARPGQLHDANSYLLAAAAKAEGCQVWRVQVPSDDPEEVRQAIGDQMIRADLIITTGGVSKGDHDVVKEVMPSVGSCDFCEVAMQPGKPQGFGLIGEDRVPTVMLPGNPVSCYVSFHAFVRPLIRKLMGLEPVNHRELPAVAGSAMTSVKGKLQFARARVSERDGRLVADLVGGHSSHLLANLAASNALVLLGEDVETVAPGEPVTVWRLGND
ncbi:MULTISPECIES: molybdotransferase-like divisome protein Glp [unclassified Luteococcus]|uniref:molybdotransferase-like divisome protein Glp n=1 Tax=unclassified Luteococcus TaxID=2639923 RepID=UPI00313EE746